MKRLFDLSLCLLSLPLVLPLFVLIAFFIWCDDGGPIFFMQTCAGWHRKPFRIFKFRTMRDQQITRVGRYLRQTGLDETAQWINVVIGDMSIVGPRPLTLSDITRLQWDTPKMDARFTLKPGITGLAQLYGGVGERWTRAMDRLYRSQAGVLLDMRIVFWSIAVNVFGKRRVRRVLLTKNRNQFREIIKINHAHRSKTELGHAARLTGNDLHRG